MLSSKWLPTSILFSLCLACVVPISGQDTDVQESLSLARSKYDHEVEQANAELLEAIKSALQNAADEGDLDKVQEMMKVEKEFHDNNLVPGLKVLEDASAKYRQKIRSASSSYKVELKELEVQLTKQLRTDNAKSVRAIIEQFTNARDSSRVEQVHAAGAKPSFDQFTGTWDFKWGTAEKSKLYSFRIDSDGNIYWQDDRPAKLEIRNNRVLWLTESSHLNLELIRRGDELIVLGWSTRKRRHPMGTAKNSFERQPDQVGIAYKK